MTAQTQKVAVITGANRGLGLETARELARTGIHVVLTSRNADAGERAAAELKRDGLDVSYHPLDVTDATSVERFAAWLEHKHGRLDVLVNNAGAIFDGKGGGGKSALEVEPQSVLQSFETNTLGAYRLTQRLAPLLRQSGAGRVVNVSSGMGQLSEMNGGSPGYRLSKAALNAVTRVFSEELGARGVKVNSVCPGWVRTDMGGPHASRSLEQGARGIVWAATLPSDGPTGGFFRDGRRLEW